MHGKRRAGRSVCTPASSILHSAGDVPNWEREGQKDLRAFADLYLPAELYSTVYRNQCI